LSAVEALSAGLIPVLSGILPFRELVARAGVGQIIDPERPREAALAIDALHRDHGSDARVWREQAMATAGSYAWPSVAARFVEIYRQAGQHTRSGFAAASDLSGAAE
jgi:alpha-1,3-mannosyltransferase